MSVSFANQTVNYFENRADGGFAWNVGFDIKADGEAVSVQLRVDLVGDDPGATASIWENGVEAIWNQKVFFSSGNKLQEVKFDLDFVNVGEHHAVTVHAGAGRDNSANWYLQQPDWGQDYLDEIAAHEVGHLIGNFDEYTGGATFGGFTNTGTLMADLTVAGFEDYFFSVEFYAEQFSSQALSTVLADVGSANGDTMGGTGGLNGFYGLGGDDRISAKGGNDFLDGGSGSDRLFGGGGRDLLKGQKGNDTLNGGLGNDDLRGNRGGDSFVFDAALGDGNVDHIRGFVAVDDTIILDRAVFAALGVGNTLGSDEFYIGASAADSVDRIIFNSNTGALLFDHDGKGGAAAVQFAIISGLSGNLSVADFLIV